MEYIVYAVIVLLMLLAIRFVVGKFRNSVKAHIKTPGEEGIAFEEVYFETKNNRKLYGWWMMKNSNFPTLILLHGWGRNVERMLPYIRMFHDRKINLLAFDSRNHGSSDKDSYSTMKKFAEDLIKSLDFIERKTGNKEAPVGVLGLSIGGAAAIYASAKDKRINSIVTVGAFANPREVMKIELSKKHVPYVPVGWVLLKYLEILVGFTFDSIAPENHIAESDAKMLLIHGTNDETVPYHHATALFNKAKKSQVELWTIRGKGHSNCHEEPGFKEKIVNFVMDTLT